MWVIDMDNKNIFANNLQKYMNLNNKSRRDVCEALNFNYYTFSDWVNGKKYPRMDKVEMLADYFGIQKSDLIEENVSEEESTKNDAIVGIIKKLRKSDKLLETVLNVCEANEDDLEMVNQVVLRLIK